MKPFFALFKQDLLLIFRNKIIVISIVVTAIYVLIFKGLSTFGDMEKFLILVIFNDPALLGFLIVGVMVLFEQNENTLQALAVTPMKVSHYLWSKSILLSLLSMLCCVFMVMASKGIENVNLPFLMSAAFITTLLFAFIGFIMVAGERNFSSFMLKSVGVIMLLAAPFLAYFDLLPKLPFYIFPTQIAIDLFDIAFHPHSKTFKILNYFGAGIWLVSLYWVALKRMRKTFER
ncbi:MAG: hypothetical protein IPL23_06235 [Saprospiraceae bacterium]|nr:hypothetical protein [Saprospiraceae bacterium]